MSEGWADGVRKTAAYPVVYMFGMTALCASALVALATSTRERVEANEQVRFERAVLEAAAATMPERPLPGVVHRLYQERVGEPSDGTGGAYRLMEGGETVAYVLPFEGQGFWDIIRGVIGIGTDRTTVLGVAIYEQYETPGLGAEIAGPDFEGRFGQRRLAEGDRPLRLMPPGAELGAGDVHAVTGATQTCTRLERILNQAIEAWRERMDGA
jgi:Na+-transporting NADH:ubiquinone oxidoreductase subunit C